MAGNAFSRLNNNLLWESRLFIMKHQGI